MVRLSWLTRPWLALGFHFSPTSLRITRCQMMPMFSRRFHLKWSGFRSTMTFCASIYLISMLKISKTSCRPCTWPTCPAQSWTRWLVKQVLSHLRCPSHPQTQPNRYHNLPPWPRPSSVNTVIRLTRRRRSCTLTFWSTFPKSGSFNVRNVRKSSWRVDYFGHTW